MSHKTEIKTELTNRTYLKKALTKLGFTFTEAEAGKKIQTTSQFRGSNSGVDIRLDKHKNKSLGGSIGFRENKDGTYTCVGDFWGLSFENGERMTMEKLKNKVTARSKEAEINDHLVQLGFEINQAATTNKNGVVKQTFERWV